MKAWCGCCIGEFSALDRLLFLGGISLVSVKNEHCVDLDEILLIYNKKKR